MKELWMTSCTIVINCVSGDTTIVYERRFIYLFILF